MEKSLLDDWGRVVLLMGWNMEDSELISLLAATEAFDSAPEEALNLIIDAGEIRQIEPSQNLIHQGETGGSIWMLLEGTLDVKVGDQLANQISNRGEVVGEISAISHTPATATVQSTSSGSAFCIPQEAVHRAMVEYPDLAGSMLRSMAKYLGRL